MCSNVEFVHSTVTQHFLCFASITWETNEVWRKLEKSQIHTVEKAVLGLDQTVLTLTFLIWKCLGSCFEIFILTYILLG